MKKIREKIGRLVILAVALPAEVAGYVCERFAREFQVDPVDERDVEIGELRAALEEALRSLGAEVNARLAAEMEVGRLKSEHGGSAPTLPDNVIGQAGLAAYVASGQDAASWEFQHPFTRALWAKIARAAIEDERASVTS